MANYWVVRHTNHIARTVSLNGPGNPEGATVPSYMPMPERGSEVVWDENTNSVISIINLASETSNAKDWENMPGSEDGSYSFRLPGKGFIGLYRGLRAMFGATLDACLSFDGKDKKVTVRAEDFNLEGPKFKMRITAPPDPVALPGIELALSDQVSFLLTPSDATMKLHLFGMFDALISEERILVTARNVFTKKRVVLVDENFKERNVPNEDDTKRYNLAAKLLADIRDVEVHMGALDIGASDISLVSSSGALLSGTETVISGGKKVSINAPNVKIDLGENLKPGGLQINNGFASHFRMTSSGLIKMYGKSVMIGGTDETVANGFVTLQILFIILTYLTGLNSALMSLPPTSGYASGQQTLLSDAMMNLKDVPNLRIMIGKNMWQKKAVE